MEGHCSIGQSPQWAVVSMEEEEKFVFFLVLFSLHSFIYLLLYPLSFILFYILCLLHLYFNLPMLEYSVFLCLARLCSQFTCRWCALDTLNVRTGYLEKVNLAVYSWIPVHRVVSLFYMSYIAVATSRLLGPRKNFLKHYITVL